MQDVPAFEDTWIECLGDLEGYRMATKDMDVMDWLGPHWHSTGKAPTRHRLSIIKPS